MSNITEDLEVGLSENQMVLRGEPLLPVYSGEDISMTVCLDNICFSKTTVTSLKNCEKIHIYVNIEEQRILISPADVKSKSGVRWTNDTSTPVIADCKIFTNQLYQKWGWNPDSTYKASGRILVSAKGTVKALFDFKSPETLKSEPRAEKESRDE